MKELQGCNAIVTGASRGIGVHIARALAQEGVNLALSARSVNPLKELRDEIEQLGVDVTVIPADLADPSQLKHLAGSAEKKLGSIEILINNAGVEYTSPFQEYPVEKMDTMIKVNLLAPMVLTRALLPGMLKQGRGHIVNISSLAGKTGLPHQTPYATTKAGLVMFTQSLRTELMGGPVGASVICPGFVSGDGMYARMEDAAGRAPWITRPTTMNEVVKAVIKSIKKDLPELIVNPVPMRPGIILREIAPGIVPLLHKLAGTAEYAQNLSDKQTGA